MKKTAATNRPACVITGDVHFTLQTLELATSVVRQVLAKAKELDVPAVFNGDTLDSKAIIRGEIANRLIELFEPEDPTKIYINRGNHDALHERVTEHSLNFLRPYAQVISTPTHVEALGGWVVPYFSDKNALRAFLDTVPEGARLIVHQGVLGASMGEYVKDDSSLPPEAFAKFRTVGSHYHKAQRISCGPAGPRQVGTFDYIGNGYTRSFTEANDPPKGFCVLNFDGTLESIPTNLRKHVIVETDVEGLDIYLHTGSRPKPDDLLWLKVRGPTSALSQVKKQQVAALLGRDNFKLDKIYADAPVLEEKAAEMTEAQVMDALIDAGSDPDAKKDALKSLWREITCS